MEKKVRSFSEVFGSEKFYEEAEKVDVKDLVDIDIIIRDVSILENFQGEFGKHDAALIMFTRPAEDDDPHASNTGDEIQYTTICSGSVLVDQVKKILKNMRALPLAARIVLRKTSNGRNEYYQIT